MIDILRLIHMNMIIISSIDVKRYDYLYQCLEIVYEHIVLKYPSYNISLLMSSLTSRTDMRGHNSNLTSTEYIRNIISHDREPVSNTISTDVPIESPNNHTTIIPILLIIHSIIMTHSQTINRLLRLLHTHEDSVKRLNDNKNKRKAGGRKSGSGVATTGDDGGKI